MTSSNFIILIIAIPLLGAFLLPLLSRLSKKIRDFWVFLILASVNVFSFFLYISILKGETFIYSVGAKFPSITSPQGFPIRIILTADALSGFLILASLFIASLALLYSRKILNPVRNSEDNDKLREENISKGAGGHFSLDKFYVLYFLLMAGISGFFFSGDFFTLFVFYEISSIATAGLIAFFKNKECFKSAFHYLVVFAVGSLFLLFGVGLLYSEYGFLNMAIIANNFQFSFVGKVALSFIASSLLLKAGVFPFYFWKPEAYKASPISAVVLSIISSLSAIYILFRIAFNIFGPNISLGWVLILFSILSIFAGVFLALKENNLKRILAYLAISELGYVILGISSGMASPNTDFGFKAIQGGLFHMVNDILDIGLLFLIAGVIIYLGKTRDVFKIRGLARKEPLLSGFFLLGVFAVSGLPPLNGFASKIMIYESVFRLSPVLAVIGILGSILTLAVLVKIFASIFLGKSTENCQPVPKLAVAVISIFAVLMISIGLFPKQFVNSFINPAANVLVDKQGYINNVIY